MVFYRTYRPQTLSELDKEDIRIRINSLFLQKEIPHALLFTGPKGTGKTSTARIVAKLLNCEHVILPKDKNGIIEPCNKCSQCKAIAEGSHVDVIEIDAASNRGIDEMRSLKEKISFTPAIGKKKIYIIDEVHMLTKEAFNALLKTLEEPPRHAVFILATTEVHKLPETILSRCVTIKFTKATEIEIERSIQRVAKKENVVVNTKTLSAIVMHADGSFRDAVKIFEQTTAEQTQGSKQILVDLLISNTIQAQKILDCIRGKNTTDAITTIENLASSGVDFLDLINQMLAILHQNLIAHVTESSTQVLPNSFSIDEIKALITALSRAHQETKNADISQLPLEMVVVEWKNKIK